MLISNSNKFSRRGVLGLGAGLGAGLAALALPAAALTPAEGRRLVEQVIAQIQTIVDRGGSDAQVLPKFEAMFDRYADVPIIAQTALGRPWRNASAGQRQDFIAAFRGYLARKYGVRFRDYQGAEIEILEALDRGSKGILVTSIVRAQTIAPFEVAYQVSDRSGSPKLFNLILEGISMLSAERAEVQALLEQNRGSVDALIADLKTRG